MDKLTREEKYKLALDSIKKQTKHKHLPKRFFLPKDQESTSTHPREGLVRREGSRPIQLPKRISDRFSLPPNISKQIHPKEGLARREESRPIQLPKRISDRFSLPPNISNQTHIQDEKQHYDIPSQTTSITSSDSSGTCEGDFDPSFSILTSDCSDSDSDKQQELIDKFDAIVDIISKKEYFNKHKEHLELGRYIISGGSSANINDINIDKIIESIKSTKSIKDGEEKNPIYDGDKSEDTKDIMRLLVSENQWQNCILFELKKYLKSAYNSDSIDSYNKKKICDWLQGKTKTKVTFTAIYEDGYLDDSDSESLHIDANCRFVYNFLAPHREHIHKYNGSTLYFKNEILEELSSTDSVNSRKLWEKYIPKKYDSVEEEMKVLTNKNDNEWQLHFPALRYTDKNGIEKIRHGQWHRKDRYRSNSFLKKLNLIRPRIFAKIDFFFEGDIDVNTNWATSIRGRTKPGGINMHQSERVQKEAFDLKDFQQYQRNNTIWGKDNYYS